MNSLELNIKVRILANTTNILKNIYKTIFVEDQVDENIEFSNYTDFIHHFNNLSIL